MRVPEESAGDTLAKEMLSRQHTHASEGSQVKGTASSAIRASTPARGLLSTAFRGGKSTGKRVDCFNCN